jgi:peptidoglycan/xylan/chitin deacetylase (PgdA/CDA1 family)
MTVCNHTFSHNLQLVHATSDLVDAEVRSGADALQRVTGQAPRFFRAPGGSLSQRIEYDANGLGEQVLAWDVDPSDYRRPGPPGIVARVVSQVHPGSIILLHDGGGDRSQTLAALPVIIAKLVASGYSFTTPDAIGPTPLGPPAPALVAGRAAPSPEPGVRLVPFTLPSPLDDRRGQPGR